MRPAPLLLSLLLLAPGAALASDPQSPPLPATEGARRVLDDPTYQKELPLYEAEFGWSSGDGGGFSDAEGPVRIPDMRRETRPGEPPQAMDLSGGGDSGLAQVILWVILGAGVVGLVFFLVHELMNRRARLRETSEEGPEVPEERELEPLVPLDEVEALAAQGRYAEAIHLLLVRVLGWVARHADEPPTEAMTSREILSDFSTRGVRPGVQGALRDLVDTVEISLFGRQPVDRQIYERCTDQYRKLEDTLAAAS